MCLWGPMERNGNIDAQAGNGRSIDRLDQSLGGGMRFSSTWSELSNFLNERRGRVIDFLDLSETHSTRTGVALAPPPLAPVLAVDRHQHAEAEHDRHHRRAAVG